MTLTFLCIFQAKCFRSKPTDQRIKSIYVIFVPFLIFWPWNLVGLFEIGSGFCLDFFGLGLLLELFFLPWAFACSFFLALDFCLYFLLALGFSLAFFGLGLLLGFFLPWILAWTIFWPRTFARFFFSLGFSLFFFLALGFCLDF